MEFRCFPVYELIYTALHMYFRLMAAIFDLSLTPMSESVHTSPTELLDPETVDVAFGISLLSSIEAEILRYFICTSGNGGHL